MSRIMDKPSKIGAFWFGFAAVMKPVTSLSYSHINGFNQFVGQSWLSVLNKVAPAGCSGCTRTWGPLLREQGFQRPHEEFWVSGLMRSLCLDEMPFLCWCACAEPHATSCNSNSMPMSWAVIHAWSTNQSQLEEHTAGISDTLPSVGLEAPPNRRRWQFWIIPQRKGGTWGTWKVLMICWALVAPAKVGLCCHHSSTDVFGDHSVSWFGAPVRLSKLDQMAYWFCDCSSRGLPCFLSKWGLGASTTAEEMLSWQGQWSWKLRESVFKTCCCCWRPVPWKLEKTCSIPYPFCSHIPYVTVRQNGRFPCTSICTQWSLVRPSQLPLGGGMLRVWRWCRDGRGWWRSILRFQVQAVSVHAVDQYPETLSIAHQDCTKINEGRVKWFQCGFHK